MGYQFSDREFWLVISMFVLLTLLVAGLVMYQVRFQRRAYLGGRLLDVCGGDLKLAHREVDNLEEELDLVAGRAFKTLPPGTVVELRPSQRPIDLTNLQTKSPPCENFAGLKPKPFTDPVCECGHGASLHHLHRRWCLHGECTCHRFSGVVVES